MFLIVSVFSTSKVISAEDNYGTYKTDTLDISVMKKGASSYTGITQNQILTDGDKVKFQIDINIASTFSISLGEVYLMAGGKEVSVDLSYSKKSSGDYHCEGIYTVNNNSTFNGKWQIESFLTRTNKLYDTFLYNSAIYTPVSKAGASYLDLSKYDFEVTGTNTDTTAPVIDLSSLSVLYSNGTNGPAAIGEKVTIGVDVLDTNIDLKNTNTDISLIKPMTGNRVNIGLSLISTQPEGNLTRYHFAYTKTIQQDDQYGTWKVFYLQSIDKDKNLTLVANSETWATAKAADLSKADFTVKKHDMSGDYVIPTVDLSSIKVDKTETVNGEGVTYSVDAADNVGISSVTLQIINKAEHANLSLPMILDANGHYSVIVSNLNPGLWQIHNILVYDKSGNYIYEYNSDIVSATLHIGNINYVPMPTGNVMSFATAADQNKYNFENATITVTDSDKRIYTGSAIEPGVQVTYGVLTLAKDSDYTLRYENNTEAGTATVTVVGKGKYTDMERKAEFTIQPKPVSDTTMPEIAPLTYSGKEMIPTVAIKDGEKVLIEGTDYSLTYADNVDVGTAFITVKGLKNYTGTSKITFEIKAAEEEKSPDTGDRTAPGLWALMFAISTCMALAAFIKMRVMASNQ